VLKYGDQLYLTLPYLTLPQLKTDVTGISGSNPEWAPCR